MSASSTRVARVWSLLASRPGYGRTSAFARRRPTAPHAAFRVALLAAGCLALFTMGPSGTCGIGITPTVMLVGHRTSAPLGDARVARGRRLTSTEAVKTCESEAFLDEAIASTLNGSPSVLVVTYSTTWCGPCKLMDPKVHELSDTFSKDAVFIKVTGDKSDNDGMRIMKREGVRTVPFYQIYKEGKKVDSVSGADAEALQSAIVQHTGK